MASYVDFAPPAPFEFRNLGITREGTLRITDFDEDAFRELVGGGVATVSFGVDIQASQQIRTPCPSPWRHPLRWLRWNPFLLDGTLITRLQLTDARLEQVEAGASA
jgi:hypothetical protein